VKLRVGIDARRYSATGRGQERYVRSLVRALAAAEGEHEYVLLGHGDAAPVGALGARVTFSPASRHIRLQHRTALTRLRRLLVRRFDLVHFPLADGWYAPVSRTAVTIHDLSVLRYPAAYFPDTASERRQRRHFAAVTSHADAVIAVSEATKQDIVGFLGVPEGRVAVIPHGVDPAFRPVDDPIVLEKIRRRYRLPPRYVLFVGGMDFKKNVPQLIAGFALASSRGALPHALVLAGTLQQAGNPVFEDARRQAAAAHVSDHLVWAAYVSETDLPALYTGADVLAFPSLWEGFGFPVLEAMACGTPVVTSEGSAMVEIAGGAALLVDPLDREAIADGILSAIGEGKSSPLVDAGLRHAAEYTWGRTAVRTIEVYEAVAAGRPLGQVVGA
jgi:glycosyltransferase involved in cell wall biosynthesis